MKYTKITNEFRRELTQLINRHSIENLCNTPDFITAGYLIECLEFFAHAVRLRDQWFGYNPWSDELKPPESPDSVTREEQ